MASVNVAMVAITVRGCDVYVWEKKAVSYNCFAEDCTWYAKTKRGEERERLELLGREIDLHPLVVWTIPVTRPKNRN